MRETDVLQIWLPATNSLLQNMLEPIYPVLVYTFVKDPFLRPASCAALAHNCFTMMGMHHEGLPAYRFLRIEKSQGDGPSAASRNRPHFRPRR
jgi:hypothetical protein